MNFKDTFIRLKDSDKTLERIKEIADKYSRASGSELDWYLKYDDITTDWNFIEIDTHFGDKVSLEDSLGERLQEITEQDLDNYLLTQLPNKEEDAEECCEGVVKDSNDVTERACFQEVANILGEEDAEYELNKVKMKHLDGCLALSLNLDGSLLDAFKWGDTPQGSTFWDNIDDGQLPEEYKQKPFKPTLVIDEDVVNRMKEGFNDEDESIGSLVEKLYTSLPQSDVTININGNGQITISGDKIPTVDVSSLEPYEVTKAYEAMVMLEGLFVDY